MPPLPLLLVLVLAVDPSTSSAVADIITALGGLLTACAALLGAAAVLRPRRNRNHDPADDVERADPLDGLRQEVNALTSALRTKEDEAEDLRRQLTDCRRDRDRSKADADLAAGRLALAVQQIGDRDRQHTDDRHRIETLEHQLREAT